MQGSKDQKDVNETRNTVSEESDERALVEDLRTFVEESEQSIPKIACVMGVFGHNPQYVDCRKCQAV
jgi:hypothetical protein